MILQIITWLKSPTKVRVVAISFCLWSIFLNRKNESRKVDNTLEYIRSHFVFALSVKNNHTKILQKVGSSSIFVEHPISGVYYLSHIFVAFVEGGEQSINSELPLRTQLLSQDGKRPSIFLRYKEKDPDRGYIRIYPGSQR